MKKNTLFKIIYTLGQAYQTTLNSIQLLEKKEYERVYKELEELSTLLGPEFLEEIELEETRDE